MRQKSDRPGEARRAERHYAEGVRPGVFLWHRGDIWAHRCSRGGTYVLLATEHGCDTCGLRVTGGAE